MATLERLSDGVLIRILTVGDAHNLGKCERTCRRLRTVIQESTRLQYLKECYLSERAPFPEGRGGTSSDLLQKLRSQNDEWASLNLKEAGEVVVPCPIITSPSIQLMDDVLTSLTFDGANKLQLLSLDLCTSEIRMDQLMNSAWTDVAVGLDPIQDLLISAQVVLQPDGTRREPPEGAIDTIDLVCLSISGEADTPHPLAAPPLQLKLDCSKTPSSYGTPDFHVAGDHVVLLFPRYNVLHVIQWTTGVVKSPEAGYTCENTAVSAFFISQHTIALFLGTSIDILTISAAPHSLSLTVSLQLPDISNKKWLYHEPSYMILPIFTPRHAVRVCSSDKVPASGLHHALADADPGVFVIHSMYTPLNGIAPEERFLILVVHIHGILRLCRNTGAKTEDADSDNTLRGPVRVPWRTWSAGNVLVLQLQLLAQDRMFSYGSRVIIQRSDDLACRLTVFDFSRRARRLANDGDSNSTFGGNTNDIEFIDSLVLKELEADNIYFMNDLLRAPRPDERPICDDGAVSMPFTVVRKKMEGPWAGDVIACNDRYLVEVNNRSICGFRTIFQHENHIRIFQLGP